MSSGVGGSGLEKKLWVLSDLDRGEDIVGQFVPQSLTKEVSADIGQVSSLNRDYPILQWLKGEVETITFRAKLFATDSFDATPDERYVRLESLVRRNSDLKRPPICSFSWGSVGSLNVECLVRSIGGVVWDEIRDDGTTRGVSMNVTLLRYEEVEFEATDPTKPESFTRIRRARRGDTYESIFRDEYGAPELGILARQLNPRTPGMDLADLSPNDKVHVYPEDYLLSLPITPEFHAFKTGAGNEAAEARRREIFDARADDKFTTIYGDTAPDEFL